MAIGPDVLKDFEAKNSGYYHNRGKPDLARISYGKKKSCAQEGKRTLEVDRNW